MKRSKTRAQKLQILCDRIKINWRYEAKSNLHSLFSLLSLVFSRASSLLSCFHAQKDFFFLSFFLCCSKRNRNKLRKYVKGEEIFLDWMVKSQYAGTACLFHYMVSWNPPRLFASACMAIYFCLGLVGCVAAA